MGGRRAPSDLGRSESIYDGIRRTGEVTRRADGYVAVLDGARKPLGTFATHGEATRAIFYADRAQPRAARP